MSSDTSTAGPLLRSRQPSNAAARPSALSLILSRAVSTTQRRAASRLVRETAARELEERCADLGYSKPVVAFDTVWNLAFVVVSVVLLICTVKENPNVPIRVWVCGYVLQCMVSVILVWEQYSRRSSRLERNRGRRESSQDEYQSESVEEDERRSGFLGISSSNVERCESISIMASFLWWIVGFYWVMSGGEILLQDAPRLYWLAVVFLAFDVIFAMFFVVLACLIGIALCCCLPCIIAILSAIAGPEGASEADLSILPKYRYQACKNEDREGNAAGIMVPIETSNGNTANERRLSPEDTECCICLCPYEDGTEVHALPCSHHFHSTCIVKWLKMNATCPLCKHNILTGSDEV